MYYKKSSLVSLPSIKSSDFIIAVAFTGHNASITIAQGNKILEVIELERFLNLKNADYSNKPWKNAHTNAYEYWDRYIVIAQLNQLKTYISDHYTDEFALGLCVDRILIPYSEINLEIDLRKIFKVRNNNWHRLSHHLSHGAGAFFQSPFEKSIVFTFDGGSPDGSTACGIYDRDGTVNWIDTVYGNGISLGRTYFKFGRLLNDIVFSPYQQSLIYPGKLMGLVGYGTPDPEIVKLLKPLFFKSNVFGAGEFTDEEVKQLQILSDVYSDTFLSITRTFDTNPYTGPRLSGERAYVLAASAQAAFEEVALEIIRPVVEQYPNLPICISGGCGLNINFNTRLALKENLKIFVPPDPTDCGLSYGAMLWYLKPQKPMDNPYLGPKLLDKNMLGTYLYEEVGVGLSKWNVESDVTADNIARYIAGGKIVGVCQGRSERGPRALGNRSIICSAQIPDMKDIINAKVKHREWFRPFSPIVRLEDVSKYFEWEGESKFMTFAPLVREEYRDLLKPITHVDGTARVQTITREQNKFIYDLLTALDHTTGIGVILNTSFNVDSKPIVSSVRDAIRVFKTTELDALWIEGLLITKM